MTTSPADRWIDSGCRSAATVLRSVAAALVDLADWLEGNEGRAAPNGVEMLRTRPPSGAVRVYVSTGIQNAPLRGIENSPPRIHGLASFRSGRSRPSACP